MAPPEPSTPAPKKKKVAKVPESPSLDDAFKATLATITEQMNEARPRRSSSLTTSLAQLEKLSARRQLKVKDAIQRVVSQALHDQLAEQEAASAPPQWQSQQVHILPPTQPSQSYNDIHAYYEGLHSAQPSRPASTWSAFSSAGFSSSPYASSSEHGVLYNGLNRAVLFDA